VTVDDHGFAPPIVNVQNKSLLSLTVTNAGTRPHGFSVDCLPTPNARDCPARSCFPDDATIAPLAPGASKTVKFATPAVEGIYTYRSRADGDAALTTGQLILQ
jgi:subtilase family serine protease